MTKLAQSALRSVPCPAPTPPDDPQGAKFPACCARHRGSAAENAARGFPKTASPLFCAAYRARPTAHPSAVNRVLTVALAQSLRAAFRRRKDREDNAQGAALTPIGGSHWQSIQDQRQSPRNSDCRAPYSAETVAHLETHSQFCAAQSAIECLVMN
ncbi:Uncharacterised protein [Vibrio cholerae]|nr:Uncharacterised protein [Vibrio cholerae]CSC94246.1 Uncharacterised protein [Vibrio cholerae]